MEKFNFISDLKLRAVLERDAEELEKCLSAEAIKSVLVLSGSIIEAILLDYFLTRPPLNKSEMDILKLSLAQLIELAEQNKLITSRSKDLSTVIRTYRNLIHPGKEIRENESFDKDSAIVANSLLNMIVKEISFNYQKEAGFSAQDIISKIKKDNNTIIIYESLIERMNRNEKIKLMNYLTDGLLDNTIDIFPVDAESYLTTLINILPKDIIETQLEKLVHEVEGSTEERIMMLYEWYQEYLDYLPTEKYNFILKYVISVVIMLLGESKENKTEISAFHYNQGFKYLAKHIETLELKKELENLTISLIRAYHNKPDKLFLKIFAVILKELKPTTKQMIHKYLEYYMSDQFEFLYAEDFLKIIFPQENANLN